MRAYTITELARETGVSRCEIRALATFCGIPLEPVGRSLVVCEPDLTRLRSVLERFIERARASGLERGPAIMPNPSVPSPVLR